VWWSRCRSPVESSHGPCRVSRGDTRCGADYIRGARFVDFPHTRR
jgi:hypothetical protein